MLIRSVYCNFQIEIWHCWPNAPEKYGYLKNSHRHMFHFKVSARVAHPDRQIEFIEFKRHLTDQLSESLVSTPESPIGHSCEDMAKVAVETVRHYYSPQWCSADVSEDGENGAVVEWIED